MPAYRSSAEAEIRDAVVKRIREQRPNARIIHEINVSTYGPNRIDVLAVDTAEIIAVEIKSEKDKLDRLPAQIAAMRGCAHHVIAAIHEKFLVESKTHEKAAHFQRGDEYFLGVVPPGLGNVTEEWVHPERRRSLDSLWHDHLAIWKVPAYRPDMPLPAGAIDLLWRDELYSLCGALRVSATRRSTMPDMVAALRWHCSGKELTKGICAMLRTRHCVEADPIAGASHVAA
jgi:hypothetical protein